MSIKQKHEQLCARINSVHEEMNSTVYRCLYASDEELRGLEEKVYQLGHTFEALVAKERHLYAILRGLGEDIAISLRICSCLSWYLSS
jgi:hypothetical protein